MTACAISSCGDQTVEGSSFCATHKAKTQPSAALSRRPVTASADAALICPHCQVRGSVHSERTKMKRGVSGGKATGAVLTGGLSLFATGLSRKESVTRMSCGHCRTSWVV